MMEKVYVKKCFVLFVPWESELTQAEIVSEPNLGLYLEDDLKARICFNLRLFCKQRVTSKEYEQQDCLCWARTPFIFRKRTDEEQQPGFLLRLKVKQSAFDFRKVNKRLIRIQIDSSNSAGQVLNAATTQFFQLLPRKRNTDLISVVNKEVIIPLQWQINTINSINNENNIATENPTLVSDELIKTLQLLNHTHDELGTHIDDSFATLSSTRVYEDSNSELEPILLSSEESEQSYNNQYRLSLMHEEHATDNSQYMVLYDGNAEVVGNFRALNFYKASDINIKEDVRLLMGEHDPRGVLLNIDGVSYKFKPGTTHSTQRRFVAYIAQQIESVVPEAVQLIDGILHVDYESLIPYLSESIKQNFHDIQGLKSDAKNIDNVKSEQQRIKAIVDLLYNDFLKRDRSPRKHSNTSTIQERRARATRRILFAVLSIISTVSAVMLGVYIVVNYNLPIDDQTPSTPPSTEPLPTSSPLPSFSPIPSNNPLSIIAPMARVVNSDREVLIDIYNSTNGDNWKLRGNRPYWLSDTPMCEWNGVKCVNGRVVEIGLHYSNLQGTIPDSIGNLTMLEVLELPGNNLTGTIPASIIQLKNLTILNLEDNPNMYGTIPELPQSITQFYARLCNLSGTIPPSISNLPELYTLRLPQNQLHGTIPPLPASVVVVTLSDNKLEGTLPYFNGNRNLRLDVRNNSLTGTLDNLRDSTVSRLHLTNNKFTSEVVSFNMTFLLDLFISGNNFTSFNKLASKPVGNLFEPFRCDARGNSFRCPIPSWLKKDCKATCI